MAKALGFTILNWPYRDLNGKLIEREIIDFVLTKQLKSGYAEVNKELHWQRKTANLYKVDNTDCERLKSG